MKLTVVTSHCSSSDAWCYLASISCRKEITFKKEKNKEPVIEDSPLTLHEQLAPSRSMEVKPLRAQDKVGWHCHGGIQNPGATLT